MTVASPVHRRRRRNVFDRLTSAAIGSVLLLVGFSRREERRSTTPAMPMGRPRTHSGAKSRPVWTEVAKLFYSAIGEHRVVSIAAGVTFFALLAIFPAIGAIVSVYGIFSDPAVIRTHLSELSSLLPGGAIDIIGEQLQRLTSGGRATLGGAFVVSLAVSLWSANAGMKALFDALNIVYGAMERRGLIKLNAVSLLFTTGAVTFLLTAIAAVVVLPAALGHVGLEKFGELAISILRWPALYLMLLLGLALIYRFGPDRDNAQWHWITWGSAIGALLWLAASLLFSWYAANFGAYNKTYGSLGAAIGFMTWIWVSSIVILAGAEIDAVMERLDRGTAK